ncbi:MAG: FAD-dependent oxidoreductase [Nanoarchaeota archaeon]|nr:FAD-dependent oxidoreductase [Nanoarchaeota archaeon]MBU1623190.1 FAD-dependent oxidoreductase [Nanoarchaeota archaeon]
MVQSFQIKLIKQEKLTHDVFKYTFSSSTEVEFQPGQFLTFMIEKEGERKPRSYSIFDYDKENKGVVFLIKIILGGFAGSVFEKMKIGQEFNVKGPLGHFTFAPDLSPEHWFIGCGCGLAPLYNIVANNVEKFSEKKFVLLFSVKKKEDLILHKELQELEKKYSNFIYLPTLTREEWDGKTGRVQKHLPKNLKEKTFYICGIKELVVSVKDLLLEEGVAPEKVKFERYS